MAKKRDMFDDFLEKNFGNESSRRVTIAKPVDTGRELSFEERKRLAEEAAAKEAEAAEAAKGEAAAEPGAEQGTVPSGEGSAAVDGAKAAVEAPSGDGKGGGEAESPAAEEDRRRPGRPRKDDRGPVMNMNFLIEVELKQKLEKLKIDLYRSSVTDLMKEAIHDLLIKYGVEES